MAHRVVEDVRPGLNSSLRIYVELRCDGSVYKYPEDLPREHHPLFVAKIVLAGSIETKNWVLVREGNS